MGEGDDGCGSRLLYRGNIQQISYILRMEQYLAFKIVLLRLALIQSSTMLRAVWLALALHHHYLKIFIMVSSCGVTCVTEFLRNCFKS